MNNQTSKSNKALSIPLKTKMHYRQIQSKFTLIRYYAMQTVKTLPLQEQERKLLEQQISELIQNACVHGNNNKEELSVHVWYSYKNRIFTIIVEDEGNGFRELEHWEKWNEKRSLFSTENNQEEFALYAAYQKRGSCSPEYYGGTGLFSAFSYWDGGFSFSKEGNSVTASKIFYPSFLEEDYELN